MPARVGMDICACSSYDGSSMSENCSMQDLQSGSMHGIKPAEKRGESPCHNWRKLREHKGSCCAENRNAIGILWNSFETEDCSTVLQKFGCGALPAWMHRIGGRQ